MRSLSSWRRRWSLQTWWEEDIRPPKKDLLDPFRINISQHFFPYEISLAMRCFPYTVTPIQPPTLFQQQKSIMHSELSISSSCFFGETTKSKDLLLVALLVFGTPFSLALKCKMIMFGWPTNLWKVHKSCGKLMKFIFWPNLRHGRNGIHKKKG